jgi:hypothetical protein
MENLRYLLAAIAALTLIMSVVSGVSPTYFTGLDAYAIDEEDDENDISGSDDEEHEDDEDKGKSGKNSDEEHEDDEDKLVQSLGNHSRVSLEIDDDAELEVEIEDGDLGNGTYDVMFACNSPVINEEFTDALEVQDGVGKFDTNLSLSNGTYTGCEVDVGGLSVTFPSFSVMAREDDDDEEDEEDEEENEGEEEQEREREDKSKLKTDDDGVELEVEMDGLDMADGSYDAVFACEQPAFNMTLDNAFEVEGGEGELETEIGLEDDTYSGCDITVEGTVIASFDTFTVSEDTKGEQEQEVEEKRKEKKEKVVTTTSSREIHEKHRGENAASPGEYESDWNYSLMANGTATHRNQTETASTPTAEVNINMTVWKSTGAIILLDVIDGTVEVGNQTYTVVLGYALYTINYDTLRVGALVVDEDGNVYKLKLTGSAEDSEAEFPMESGSIDLNFEGSRGPPDRFGDWELTLEGTVEAA